MEYKPIKLNNAEPFNVDDILLDSFDGSLTKIIEEMCKSVAEQREKIIVDFLKLHGYRPKNTKEYARNLKYSLHRKGLEVVCEISHEPFTVENRNYTETFRVFFKPYTKRNSPTNRLRAKKEK